MGNEYRRISRRQMLAENEVKEAAIKHGGSLSISDDINRKDIVQMGDALFFERVMFSFENNRYTNAIFINEIKDREFSDLGSSYNVEYNPIESCIALSDKTDKGVYLTTSISTSNEKLGALNDFFLIVDEDVPPKTDILYYLVTNFNEVYPIKPNNTLPLRIEGNGIKPISFKIKAVINPNGNDIPKIRGIAVLYYDSYVAKQMGLYNPDLGKFDKEVVPLQDDVVTLIRDPLQDDKLVQVVSSTDDVKLLYSDDGEELDIIQNFDATTGKQTEESKLIYGDYMNSDNEIERVLHQIRTRREF